jgi:hypothetical protein
VDLAEEALAAEARAEAGKSLLLKGFDSFLGRHLFYLVVPGADNYILPVQGFLFKHSTFGQVEAVLQSFGEIKYFFV